MASIFQQLDAQLDQILAGWSIYTTFICIGIAGYLVYPLVIYTEPDLHPYLLARQSSASRVRQPGETAIYRAQETPHGYPLRTGLNVKDPGAPKWTAGRDGDLRDVWRRAALGAPGEDGKSNGVVGKVQTVLGKEEVLDTTFGKLSAELNAVGKHLKEHGSTRIAIYLSNSTELLVALMAACFYGFAPILIAQEQGLSRLATILKKTNADALIAGAGSVPLTDLLKEYGGLKQVVWVVARTSRHLDWNEVSEGEGGKADISTWHDIVDGEGSSASSELPSSDPSSQVPNVILVSEPAEQRSNFEIVEFTQKNLTSAIAAQLAVLPRAHRLSPADTLIPLTPLTKIYPLILTLTALFSNTSLALTSVTGRGTNYTSAFHGVSPTIIIADPASLSVYERKRASLLGNGFFAAQRHKRLLENLTKGIFPPSLPPVGQGSPRLIYSWDISNPDLLNNLRVFTGARLVIAYTNPNVAGAISQTAMLDYRPEFHFGPPLSSVEFKLTEIPGRAIDANEPQGRLQVTGPAVVGGQAVVEGPVMKVTESGTLAGGEAVPDEEVAKEIERAMGEEKTGL